MPMFLKSDRSRICVFDPDSSLSARNEAEDNQSNSTCSRSPCFAKNTSRRTTWSYTDLHFTANSVRQTDPRHSLINERYNTEMTSDEKQK